MKKKNKETRKIIKIHNDFIENYNKLIANHTKHVLKAQSKCKHDEGWDKNVIIYWAPGHSMEVDVCRICGHHKNFLDDHPAESSISFAAYMSEGHDPEKFNAKV